MKEFGQFPSCAPVPAVMEEYFLKGKFSAKLEERLGAPHKRSAWILNRKVFLFLQAKLGKVTSDLI